MDRLHPMDLPELTRTIAPHLSACGLQACALVCKTWHAAFQPLVWSTLIVNHGYFPLGAPHCSVTRRDGCAADALCKHCVWERSVAHNGHHVRHLKLEFPFNDPQCPECLGLLHQHCTSLKGLEYLKPMSNDDLVDKLIARNPRIKSLSTYKIACLQQSMAVLSHLTKLDFRGELGVQDVVSVLEAFPRLQELSISGDIVDFQRLVVSDISTEEEDRSRWHSSLSSSPSLKRLSMLSSARADISPILERCPNIEWLQFPGMQTVWDATLNVLRSGLFSRLTTLSCACLKDADEFERVLQAIPHLQLRNVSLCDPAASTIQALAKYHGQRLERLNLFYLLSIPENPLVVALSQFPALKSLIMETLSLYCTRLKLPDLRELINQPWSCSQLEHLDIPVTLERQQDAHIDAGEENGTPLSQSDPAVAEWEQAQTLFMERLGALTRLRQIQLWGYWKGRYQPGCDVTWRLSAGLGKLQGLRHLEGLYLGYPQHKLEITELQWMKQHFVRLKKLEVCGIEDGPLHDWLHDHWPELSVVDLNKVNDLDDDLIDY